MTRIIMTGTLRKMVALSLLGGVLFAACGGSREGRGAGAASSRADRSANESEAVTATGAPPDGPAADPVLDDIAGYLSGIPSGSGKYAALEELPAWKAFASGTQDEWQTYQRATLEPMAAWAAGLFPEACGRTGAVFYPFGGPDAINALTLFPAARKIILLGLEPAGNLPDLDSAKTSRIENFFRRFALLTSDFIKRGYFVTETMNQAFKGGNPDGTLPVIVFFIKRAGYIISAITRLEPADGATGWKERPYFRQPRRPKRPYGVRVDCFKPGDAGLTSVYYFACDLADAAFARNAALYRFFEGQGELATFIKSASYLLHYTNFSRIRTFILEKSLYVVQDDTGVPYKWFLDGTWDIELFGRYVGPVSDFKGVEQADLRAAFEAGGAGVNPIPFHFGYHWRTKDDNLLFMKKRGGGGQPTAGLTDATPPVH